MLKLPNAPPREQVEEAERALRLDALLELRHGIAVDAGHADRVAQAIEQDHRQQEQDLVPQIGDPEDVLQVREHRRAPRGGRFAVG